MSHKITIILATGNDAFKGHEASETARILHEIADSLNEYGEDLSPAWATGPLMDINGNRVGSLAVEEE